MWVDEKDDGVEAPKTRLKDTMPEERSGKNGRNYSPFLTPRQKRFCRLYITYNEDHLRAASEVYPDMKKAASYGAELVRENPKIQQYIAFLREDAYETIVDENGRQKLSITMRAQVYLEMIEEARAFGKYRDATELKGLLDKLVGRRRRQSVNLAHHDSAEDQRAVLQDAAASGEIANDELKALSNTIKDSETATIEFPISVVIPDNKRVNKKEVGKI